MDQFEKIRQAKALFDDGALTEEEYQDLKTQLMNEVDNAVNSAQASAQTAAARKPAVISNEGATTGLKVLSFLIPLAGLILFLVNKDTKPVEAKDEIKWAAIGFGIGVVSYILIVALGAAAYFY